VFDQRAHAPTRPAAVDLPSGYPVVAPGSGDSVRWRRCRVQRSGERSGSTWAPPQFSSRPSYSAAVVSPEVTDYANFGISREQICV